MSVYAEMKFAKDDEDLEQLKAFARWESRRDEERESRMEMLADRLDDGDDEE